jgi:ABC-type branched-subunit amino acid transport system substrate-binding protein
MTQAFGDEQFERELRLVLRERAEEIASRAHSAAEMTAVITPRLIPSARSRRETFLRLAAIGLILLMLLIGLVLFGARPTQPPISLLLAVDLPLQGEPAAPPIVDAVRLAISNARLPPGVSIDVPFDAVFDDAVEGSANPEQGAENMRRIAGDVRFAAVIGPFHSFVARAAIPIANRAGLLVCSASNTLPGLTVGDEAASIRPRPDRPSYVRVATTDDAAAAAAARLLIGVLHKKDVFVVTPVEPFAGNRAETFIAGFEGLGGSVVGRGSIGSGGNTAEVVAGQIADTGADAVFFDGLGIDGAPVLAALRAGGADLPFIGLDIILDGPRSAAGSFLNLAGPRAGNAYGIFPAGTDPTLGQQVQSAYSSTYGRPSESFVLSGHACTTVLLDAIGRIDRARLRSLADWREAIRTEVTRPGREYRTAVGTITFDANGDAVPQRVSIYRADPDAGDWTFWQMLELPAGA